MKHAWRIMGIAVVLLASIGVSAGTAATKASSVAWTESKAERAVVREVRLRLDRATRISLEEELRRGADRFIGAQTLAMEAENDVAWWQYFENYIRYQDALRDVRSGLKIDGAHCIGARRIEGGGYWQVDCLVTSKTLRMPAAELQTVDGEVLPTVVEGPSREVGPLYTQLRVRVPGSSTFVYQ